MFESGADGQSGATADFAFDTLSDALAALADRSRAPSLHVVGSSWGAALALRLAARHPSRVERVTLLDGGFYAVQDYPDLTWEAFANGGAPPDHACESLRTYLDFMRSDAPDFWNQDIEAAVIDQVRTEKPGGRVRPCLSPTNGLAYLRNLWEYQPLTDATQIQVPVHAIAALSAEEPAAVHAFKQQQAAAFVSSLRAGRMTVMPDTDHLIMLDRPAELARILTTP